MTTVTYEVIEHDGGWAYRVGDMISETFLSHKAALEAAQRAAAEQELGGTTSGIEYQDKAGAWHQELAKGDDRPQTRVVDGDDE